MRLPYNSTASDKFTAAPGSGIFGLPFTPQQSRIVELRFFGGLTIEETVAALDISSGTVKREWVSAKTWLHAQLSDR